MNAVNIYIMAGIIATLVIVVAVIVILIFSPTKLNRDCAIRHNHYRYFHRTPSLSVSKDVVEYAEKRAEELKTTNKFAHPKNSPFGENLYKVTFSADKPESLDEFECETAVVLWYNEYKDYNYEKGTSKNGKMVGHFTQLVWLETTHIGCAKSYSSDSRTMYLVCNYDPPGNWVGNFPKNVPYPQ